MRIGYSCWGFLGPGIIETPDGGRSHRLHLVKAMCARWQVVMLQRDRDSTEAGRPLDVGQIYDAGLPGVDAVFFEWRWPIDGRNINSSACHYTPDWHRQLELLQHYAHRVPLVVWDKDQRIDASPAEVDLLLRTADTFVLVPALYPTSRDRTTALFPFDLTIHDPLPIPPRRRELGVVYVGNDYERRADAERFLAGTARLGVRVDVYGKWQDRVRPDLLGYHGRIAYTSTAKVYRKAMLTVALAPPRYKRTGHFTQRLHESLAQGCLALVPSDHRGAEEVAVAELIVAEASAVRETLRSIGRLDDEDFWRLIAAQRARLRRFSVDTMLQVVADAIEGRLPRFEGCVQGWEP